MKSAYELAKKYYNTFDDAGNRLWPKERVDALYAAEKLTAEEYADILGGDA